MKYRREMGAAASKPPFLSVVTRCYERPTYLAENRASLASQTDRDYEQIFIIDEEGQGIHAANMALANARPEGEYVLVLDDDDKLIEETAIETLKRVTRDRPDIVVFRADHDWLGILPDRITLNRRRPIHGRIGSCDFITRRDWWERHIEAFGAPKSGDYHFLKSMWQEAPDAVWIDDILAAVQRISKGRPEPV